MLEMARVIRDAERVRALIDLFDQECDSRGETDSGEAWELLRDVRDIARRQLADAGAY